MKDRCSLVFLFLYAYLLAYVQCLKSYCYPPAPFNRSNFPVGFIFGAASSAYQYEGASDVDGRKPSIWDTFVKEHPEKISDHSNADVAEEFYYLYRKDIALMKEVGLDSFRFSISWPRILPNGRISGGVNQKGVNFYNRLIDELLSNGIRPHVTLFHWDLPQALENEYGGFLSSKIVDDYRGYADFCFKEFGDRVKEWSTLNEPNLYSGRGYATGAFAPGRCSSYIGNCTAGNSATEPYVAAHNLILSHATAVDLYRKKYQASQKGTIGLVMAITWMVPKHPTVSSKRAASRALDFTFGWIIRPMIYGDYPRTMRQLVGSRLPNFTKAQIKIVKGSLDFVGVNYYTANYAEEVTSCCSSNLSYSTDYRVNLTTQKNGIPIGEATGAKWLHIYPEGIRRVTLYITIKYKKLPIIITENGMPDLQNSSLVHSNSTLNDGLRIKYHYLHLSKLLEAIKDGVDIRGYYVWSLLDNFSWASGYTLRYGLISVDHKDGLKRHRKCSSFWFKNFLRKGIFATSGPSSKIEFQKA